MKFEGGSAKLVTDKSKFYDSRFYHSMNKHGFGDMWEAYEVTTLDGYILTTFHVPAQTATSKGSVLVQHGHKQDGSSWIDSYGDEMPPQLQLAYHGYDVWIGNNRGTEYSQRHLTYESAGASAQDFWDFSWADMAYDDVANIAGIKSVTGEDKITYLGYSQGTIQMHYALAHDEHLWFRDNLKRAIHLAPCFVMTFPDTQLYYNNRIATFRDNGIYAINGPNWEADLQRICDVYGWFFCSLFKRFVASEEPYSVKAEQHFI